MHLHILKNLEDIDVDYMTADPKLMNLMKNEIFQINLMNQQLCLLLWPNRPQRFSRKASLFLILHFNHAPRLLASKL